MSDLILNRLQLLCLFGVIIGFSPNATAQTYRTSPFEGVIEMQIKDLVNLEILSYYVSGENVRIESKLKSASDAYFLINTLDKKVYTILNARDAYIEFPLETEKNEKMPGAPKGDHFTNTGESESILGFRCTKWILTEDERTTEIWATSSLGTYVGMQLTPTSETVASFAWEPELKSRGLFPMRVTQRDASDSETYQLEVLSVKREAVNDALFQLPPGYEKLDKSALSKPRQN